jgi:hypothetical protein
MTYVTVPGFIDTPSNSAAAKTSTSRTAFVGGVTQSRKSLPSILEKVMNCRQDAVKYADEAVASGQ